MLDRRGEPYPESGQPAGGLGTALRTIKVFRRLFLLATFDHESDEMPAGRQRVVHPFGTVGGFEYRSVGDHPYTGLFQSGAIGVIRASLSSIDRQHLTPSCALKFLVDGLPSQNLVLLTPLDGQGENQNFFEQSPTSATIEPTRWAPVAVLWAFRRVLPLLGAVAGAQVTVMMLDHLAAITRGGDAIDAPRSPFELQAHPTAEVQQDPDDFTDFRVQLAQIPEGTKLYDVWVRDREGDEELTLVGEIILTHRFVASPYGDDRLFFQHWVKRRPD